MYEVMRLMNLIITSFHDVRNIQLIAYTQCMLSDSCNPQPYVSVVGVMYGSFSIPFEGLRLLKLTNTQIIGINDNGCVDPPSPEDV